jgi:hypothetical protein
MHENEAPILRLEFRPRARVSSWRRGQHDSAVRPSELHVERRGLHGAEAESQTPLNDRTVAFRRRLPRRLQAARVDNNLNRHILRGGPICSHVRLTLHTARNGVYHDGMATPRTAHGQATAVSDVRKRPRRRPPSIEEKIGVCRASVTLADDAWLKTGMQARNSQ